MSNAPNPEQIVYDLPPKTASLTPNIFESLLRHRWLILCLVVLLTPLGYLVFLKLPPEYASEAKLLIWTQAPPAVGEQEVVSTTEKVGKHLHLLGSELVMQIALEDEALRSMPSLKNEQDPVKELRSMISVEAARDASDTLLISARGEHPDDLPVIIGTVVDSYKKILAEDTAAYRQESTQLMEKLQERFSEDTEAKKQQFYELRQKLQVSETPEGGYFENPYKALKASLTAQVRQISPEYRDLQDRVLGLPNLRTVSKQQLRVAAIEAKSFLQLSDQTPDSTVATSGIDFGKITEVESRIVELTLKAKKQIESVGENHPSVQSINTELAFFQSQLDLL
ncbi:MAG: hypothetical protein AAF483_17815, partial [Planctomycetota bacterium]